MIRPMKQISMRGRGTDSSPSPFVILAAALAACTAQPAAANGFAIRPYVAERIEYNDNKQMLVNDAIGTWSSVTEFAANFERKDPRWELRITPKARFSVYSTDRIDDGDEYFLDLAPTWRGERYTLSASLYGHRESTLSSELTDSGLLVDNTDRDSYGLSMQGEYRVNPRHMLSLSTLVTDVIYQDKANTGYVDYQYLSLAPQYTYVLSERTGVFLSMYFSHFDAGVINRSDSFGAQLGASYRFGPKWNVSASLGVNHSDTEYRDILTLGDLGAPPPLDVLPALDVNGALRFTQRQRGSTGAILRATLEREYERGRISINAERRVQPSSNGAQTTETTGTISGNYRFDPRLSVHSTLYITDRTSDIPTVAGSVDRIYGSARIAVQYRLTRVLVLEGRYELRGQEYEVGNRGSASNVIGLQLTYAPDPYQPFEWFN